MDSQEAAGGNFWYFFRMNPPELHGGLNPVKAYGWTPNIERGFTTYAELQRQCCVTENSLKKVQAERDQYGVVHKNQRRPSHQFRPRPQPFKGKQVYHAKLTQSPQCQLCKKFHFRRCIGGVIRCFKCQGEGHMVIECPHDKVQMQGKSIGRVYTLDAKKAKSSNVLIASTCLVNDHPCFVLFDYG